MEFLLSFRNDAAGFALSLFLEFTTFSILLQVWVEIESEENKWIFRIVPSSHLI